MDFCKKRFFEQAFPQPLVGLLRIPAANTLQNFKFCSRSLIIVFRLELSA